MNQIKFLIPILKKNIISNSIENINAINKAVSNTTGTSYFVNTDDYATRTGNYLSNEDDSKGVKVDTVKLNDYFKDYSKINFIKIDVEGNEYFVLQGMKKILDANYEIEIILEFNPYAINRSKINVNEMIDFLIKNNFIIYFMNDYKKILEKIDKDWLVSYHKNANPQESINIFCKRPD